MILVCLAVLWVAWSCLSGCLTVATVLGAFCLRTSGWAIRVATDVTTTTMMLLAALPSLPRKPVSTPMPGTPLSWILSTPARLGSHPLLAPGSFARDAWFIVIPAAVAASLGLSSALVNSVPGLRSTLRRALQAAKPRVALAWLLGLSGLLALHHSGSRILGGSGAKLLPHGALLYGAVWLLVGSVTAARPKDPDGTGGLQAQQRAAERKRLVGAAYSLLPTGLTALLLYASTLESLGDPARGGGAGDRRLPRAALGWATLMAVISVEAWSLVLHVRPLASAVRCLASGLRDLQRVLGVLLPHGLFPSLAAFARRLSGAVAEAVLVAARAERQVLAVAWGYVRAAAGPVLEAASRASMAAWHLMRRSYAWAAPRVARLASAAEKAMLWLSGCCRAAWGTLAAHGHRAALKAAAILRSAAAACRAHATSLWNFICRAADRSKDAAERLAKLSITFFAQVYGRVVVVINCTVRFVKISAAFFAQAWGRISAALMAIVSRIRNARPPWIILELRRLLLVLSRAAAKLCASAACVLWRHLVLHGLVPFLLWLRSVRVYIGTLLLRWARALFGWLPVATTYLGTILRQWTWAVVSCAAASSISWGALGALAAGRYEEGLLVGYSAVATGAVAAQILGDTMQRSGMRQLAAPGSALQVAGMRLYIWLDAGASRVLLRVARSLRNVVLPRLTTLVFAIATALESIIRAPIRIMSRMCMSFWDRFVRAFLRGVRASAWETAVAIWKSPAAAMTASAVATGLAYVLWSTGAFRAATAALQVAQELCGTAIRFAVGAPGAALAVVSAAQGALERLFVFTKAPYGALEGWLDSAAMETFSAFVSPGFSKVAILIHLGLSIIVREMTAGNEDRQQQQQQQQQQRISSSSSSPASSRQGPPAARNGPNTHQRSNATAPLSSDRLAMALFFARAAFKALSLPPLLSGAGAALGISSTSELSQIWLGVLQMGTPLLWVVVAVAVANEARWVRNHNQRPRQQQHQDVGDAKAAIKAALKSRQPSRGVPVYAADDCCICLEPLVPDGSGSGCGPGGDDDQQLQVLQCGHQMHLGCAVTVLQRDERCPICRRPALTGDAARWI